MRTTSQCARLCCAIVFSDRRVGETYFDAAGRAAQILVDEGRPNMEVEKALEWACLEKADRELVNAFRKLQNLRGGKTEGYVRIAEDSHAACVAKLREQVGLVDKPLTHPPLMLEEGHG